MEPSEEIMKALDEIVDVNLEEVGRRVGKRSSILKQPRLDDDQIEDLQKRKSLTSKRRVSFADKFQVMELCTGNVYDIPGRSMSASDSTLNGDSKSVPEPEISNKVEVGFDISRNETKASTITEVVLTKTENTSLPFSKKHKICSDKNAEPERKKINIEETNTSPLNKEDIFKHREKLMSEYKNFLFGSADIINEVKDQSMELAIMENAVTNTSGTHDDFQQKDIEGIFCDLTSSKILSQSKSDYHLTIPESGTYKSASTTKHIVNDEHIDYDLRNTLFFENKNSYDLKNQMDPKRWASKVEVLPISLSDVPLEENKENIFVDVKNKNVLVTNARDLKLKEKLPLKLSQVSKHLGSQIEKTDSFSVHKVLQSIENFNPVSVKNITNKQNEKSLVNKTCILNPCMELTCFSSCMDLTKKIENLENDEHQLNKTCMDTSHFMDLTCNVQNLMGSLSPTVSNVCDEKKRHVTNLDVEFTEKSSDKDASIITSNGNNLSDNLLISVETDNMKELSTRYTDCSSGKKRESVVSVNRCSLTKYFSSCGMELTCDVKDNANLKINDMDLTKKLEHSVNDDYIENDEHQLNKTCMDTSHFMDLTCNVQNLMGSLSPTVSNVCDEKKRHVTNLDVEFTEKSSDKDASIITSNGNNLSDNLLISVETDNMKELSTRYTDCNSGKKRESVVSVNRCSLTKYFSSCGMELTCDVKDNANLKINDMDLTKKLEHSVNDDYIENDEHQLNKTCMDTSHFMDLTCNVQNLTDNLSSTVSNGCNEKKQYITNLGVEFTEKSLDKNVPITGDAMNFTCYANNNLFDNLISVETDNMKELSTQCTDSSSDEKRNRYSQTKYFSSCGMELTCDVKNNTNSKLYDHTSDHLDLESQSAKNCFSNNAKSELDKGVNQYKGISENSSVHPCAETVDLVLLEPANTHFHAQNMDMLDLPMNSTNKSLKTFKRGNISDNEFEPVNKVAKFSNFIEPGIVYAIKQVKGVNQASLNDYNIFKFPEVFYPLNRNVTPKTSFSCSRIQLTKAVQEAIRKSCSFSVAPREWSPEFSEWNTTSKNKLSKSPIKVNEKSATQSVKSSMFPDIPCTPQMLGTWSRTKTIKETVYVYPDNSPLPKTNISFNKDGSLSISNISPDTINCLRKSLDFDNEINSPRIIISHECEESIVENTAIVTTAIEDTFPDGSKFCLDSSISLVPNDDTFSSMSLKVNSETVNELSTANCQNTSFDQLQTISLQDVDAPSLSDGVIKTFTTTNSILKECVIQEEATERRELRDDVIQSALTAQCYKNNQDCLPHRNSMTILKQKHINQFIECSKIVPNEEIENSDCECNTKSPYLPSSKTDKKNDSHVLKENPKTSILKEFVNSQIKKPQESSKNLEQTPNKGSVQSSSADSTKQTITSLISSKSPTKLNKNEMISFNVPISSKENCSNMTAEANIIDKNSKINDVNTEDAAALQDNFEQNNRCPENPFERIHSLRKKIIQASKSEDCLWCLKEIDEKQAVFEILGDSIFACYLMCVDLEFTSKVALCTQLAFIHLKEEPDDIDELGFSLFQSLVANDIKIVPFPADELLNKLSEFVDFALSAKCLIKDVWFIAVKNEISIEDSSNILKLNIKVLNENHFSYFNVSLPISLTSYPNEKIMPEVTHIEHNVIKNEIIIDAIKKVHPGKKYLYRISEAANAV